MTMATEWLVEPTHLVCEKSSKSQRKGRGCVNRLGNGVGGGGHKMFISVLMALRRLGRIPYTLRLEGDRRK